MQVLFFLYWPIENVQFCVDVTKTGNGERGTGNGERGTGNGERGTGNGERGTGVWERVYSGTRLRIQNGGGNPDSRSPFAV